ncbi:D-glucuronyl C5-epimerase family protein [Streptomyces sp. NPDC046887]|uniref:D-glucuronyl C5-epimerase family protein n=1 Tax=Streptomyces sp. NPDC046887 TaxID=3155472 RepID=UPI0033C9CC9A
MSDTSTGLDRRALIRLTAKAVAAGAAVAAGGALAGPASGAAAAPLPPGPGDLSGMPRALALSVPRGVGGEAPLPPPPEQLADGRVSPPSGRVPYARSAPGSRAAAAVDVPTTLPFEFNRGGYRILPGLPEALRPWRNRPKSWKDVSPDTATQFLDSEGVVQFRAARDQPGYDHPVMQIQFGLGCVASYRTEADAHRRSVFLLRAEAQAKRLIDRRVEARGAWYFPYPFDWRNDKHPGVAYRAPWYSGMAQGEAISLFTQLAQLDGVDAQRRTLYLQAADAAFASLLRGDDGSPWAVHKDASDYLWIQEYPGSSPGTGDFTYNGMIFAMLGLWDYHTATGNELAAQLYDGGCTTMARYFPLLRNTRWASYYCQTHRVPTPSYQHHHIDLFHQLHWHTASADFAAHMDTLVDDFPGPIGEGGGNIAFAAGTHTLYRLDTAADGAWSAAKQDAQLEVKKVTFARATQAPTTMRRRIQDRGIYYLISGGAYDGWWVGEAWPTAFLRGEYLTYGYHHQRTITFPGGNQEVDVYRFTENGSDASIRTVSFPTPSNAPTNVRAVVNGRPMFRITAGSLAGYWVPATSVTADNRPGSRSA